MTADQFAYWLQGFAELNGGPPTSEQWQGIRDHLALVFTKVTPQRPQAPGVFPQPSLGWPLPEPAKCLYPARATC